MQIKPHKIVGIIYFSERISSRKRSLGPPCMVMYTLYTTIDLYGNVYGCMIGVYSVHGRLRYTTRVSDVMFQSYPLSSNSFLIDRRLRSIFLKV